MILVKQTLYILNLVSNPWFLARTLEGSEFSVGIVTRHCLGRKSHNAIATFLFQHKSQTDKG